jgi:hypothetical protein
MDLIEPRTYWIFDQFFADAPLLRQKIEEHFDEKIGKMLSLRKRTIWNYWYIEKLYTYFRTDPRNLFPELHESFMRFLKNFAAMEFGLTASNPFLSMYINGCGQNLHNDSGNGRLGFVFSLTKWKERRFEGGETIIHKFDTDWKSAQFRHVAGTAFYDMVEPEFNRLVLFDDRLPHAVRTIHGTMNPLDARFVMHGHLEEPEDLAFIEGGLQRKDIQLQWQQVKDAGRLIRNHGYHGFVTLESIIDPSAIAHTSIKHVQLLPLPGKTAINLESCLNEVTEILSGIKWPNADPASKLVYALCSDPLAPIVR